MAHQVDAEKVTQFKNKYGDDGAVVCYVNSTLEAKALSDICITSSNAESIISRLPQRAVYLIPDRNLGAHLARLIPDKEFTFGDGCCSVHDDIDPGEVAELMRLHPRAIVAVHPECADSVRELADCIGSTSRIIECAVESESRDCIICTVEGVRHEMRRTLAIRADEKRLHFPATVPRCPGMEMITLEGVRGVLATSDGVVTIDERLVDRARLPIQRMFDMG